MKSWFISLLLLNVFALAGCDDEYDDNEAPTPSEERSYKLDQLDNSGVSGTVSFKKIDDQTTQIVVQLTGTQAGNTHPAHIHSGAAGSGGPIVLDFNPVDGGTGKSETMVTQMNDGTAVTFEDLVAFDGHVNVHLSAAQLNVMIAQGNVGANGSAMDNGSTGNNTGY
jgi:hypothetical protein